MTPDVEFLIACGVVDDLLDDAELERLDAALDADAAALGWSEELSAAYASLSAEPEPEAPADLWERIAAGASAPEEPAAKQAEPADAPADDAPVISIALACSFCHDTLPRVEAAYCASCLAPHHDECFAEHGRCAAPGCGETHWVRAEAPAVVPRSKPNLRRKAAWVVGLGMMAGAAFALTFSAAPGQVAQKKPRLEAHDSGPVVTEPELGIVDEVVDAEPEPLRANVVRVRGRMVYLNRGKADGVQVGQHFLLGSSPTAKEKTPTWVVEVASVTTSTARATRVRALSGFVPIAGDFAELLASDAPKELREPVQLPADNVWTYYLAGEPNLRYRHLSRYLLNQSGANLQVFLETADPEFVPPTTKNVTPLRRVRSKWPGEKGLVVLGATRYASTPTLLHNWVARGGGLILLAEGQGQVYEFGAEAAMLSPVEDRAASVAEVTSTNYLRPSRELEALQGVPREGLPALLTNRRTRLRPGAKALLRDAAGSPLIAQWNVGQGQVLYVGTSELWRLKREKDPGGSQSLYHALWAELLQRAQDRTSPKPVTIALDTLGTPLRVSGPLKSGTRGEVNLYLLGSHSLVKAATLRGTVSANLPGGTRLVIEEPTVVKLPPGRYAWQSTVALGATTQVVGMGWLDHLGLPTPLRLEPHERRAKLLCTIGAALPKCDQQELRRIGDAARNYLANTPRDSSNALTIEALSEGQLPPDSSMLRELAEEQLVVLDRRRVRLERIRDTDLLKVLSDPEQAQDRLARWDLFDQGEFALLQGDTDWFRQLASYEIALRTRGASWTAPGVAPHSFDALEPPWDYLLGQLEKRVAVDPRAIPPSSGQARVVIHPQDCLARVSRPRAVWLLSRTGSTDHRVKLLDAALWPSKPDSPRNGSRAIGSPLSREDWQRARQLRAWYRLFQHKQLNLELQVVAPLQSAARLLYARLDATELRAAVDQVDQFTNDQREAHTDLIGLAESLETYARHFDRYPPNLGCLIKPAPEDVQRKNWRGDSPRTALPDDPWGEPYVYEVNNERQGYSLRTLGADRVEGGKEESLDLGLKGSR